MAQSRDSVADNWGPRTPYFGEGEWPLRVDECAGFRRRPVLTEGNS